MSVQEENHQGAACNEERWSPDRPGGCGFEYHSSRSVRRLTFCRSPAPCFTRQERHRDDDTPTMTANGTASGAAAELGVGHSRLDLLEDDGLAWLQNGRDPLAVQT